MLLYLEDVGPSLKVALNLIESFGAFSGLQINWDKSQILPLDFATPNADQAHLSLQQVSQNKYLGIQVTRTLADYTRLNVEPLYTLLKSKSQIWAQLPLGVMGHINLVKMILLPKLLYIFWHSLIYLPLRIFKIMDAILNSFIWGNSRHKLSWRALKNPVDMGGTALPDLNLYCLAAQFSHFFYLNKEDKLRYLTLACSTAPNRTIHPFQILLKGTFTPTKLGGRGNMIYNHCKIWDLAMRKLGAPSIHAHSPL